LRADPPWRSKAGFRAKIVENVEEVSKM